MSDASGEPADTLPSASMERLINVLQTCFKDLEKRTEEQTDTLQRGLDALRPKVPSADPNTKFWNAYKDLSDEFDKDFHEKYSTDLDTSLIFAGLFSAVTSAFIIQIQPGLQPDPTDATLALIRLLIHNVDGSLFSDEQAISRTGWNGPPTQILAAQVILYISLFSTLRTAFVVVLGKQWLITYMAVGTRGTLE
ncbi:hypothetical protein C8J57DRAFT_688984 [Mycena rebaudengoi]|nr:hypothetical protein C8J57DRAFT_688984 [Mycena rebaudengoi]